MDDVLFVYVLYEVPRQWRRRGAESRVKNGTPGACLPRVACRKFLAPAGNKLAGDRNLKYFCFLCRVSRQTEKVILRFETFRRKLSLLLLSSFCCFPFSHSQSTPCSDEWHLAALFACDAGYNSAPSFRIDPSLPPSPLGVRDTPLRATPAIPPQKIYPPLTTANRALVIHLLPTLSLQSSFLARHHP